MRRSPVTWIVPLLVLFAPALAGTAQAEANAGVTSVSPGETVVISDGIAYAQAVSPQHLTAQIAVKGGKKNVFGDFKLIKSWRVVLTLTAENGAGTTTFDDYAYEWAYIIYDWPRHINENIKIVIPDTVYGDWARRRCNAELDRLRDTGEITQTNVLRHDVVLGVRATASMVIDYAAGGSSHSEALPANAVAPAVFPANTKIICKAFSAEGPGVSKGLSNEAPKVRQAHLTVIEQYGPSGLCKLNLSGKIDGPPSASFGFRYEDGEGHHSDRKTVKMDHTGSALFSHSYNIQNDLHWEEHGKVRIVGDGFASPWATYKMDCVEPGATGLQAVLPPQLQMAVVPVDRTFIDGESCVTRVKLVAQIKGRGPMSGTAAFVGDHYFSAPQPYSVNTGKSVRIEAYRDLSWTATSIGGFTANPAGGDQPKSQTIKIGFNVTNQNNAVVASLPRKAFTYTCGKRKGYVAPVVGKGNPIVPAQPAGGGAGKVAPATKQSLPYKTK